MSIENEIDQMAEKMEKSQGAAESPSLEDTIRKLGPEGLKKAMPSLSEEQQALLAETLETMKKSAKMDKVVETTGEGEMKDNEKKPQQDEQDEEVAKEAAASVKNQGGPEDKPEGWEGQVIKAAEMEKEEPKEESAKKKIAEAVDDIAESEAEEAKEEHEEKMHDKKDMKKACDEGEEGEVLMKEKKAKAKENLTAMMKRMQERKMEKSVCVAVLAKNMECDPAKVEKVWDLMAKSYAEAEMELDAKVKMPEASQAEVPAQMKKEMKGEKAESDPAVPKAKTDISKDKDEERLRGGDSKQTADEGEAPPATMKKSEPSYFHVEEEVYSAPEDVFKSNTFGKNTCFNVDSYIEADAAKTAGILAKSTFMDEGEAGEELAKSEDDSADVNSLIEKSLDMTEENIRTATDNKNAKESGAFLVKSFDDSEMDNLFEEKDFWGESLGKSEEVSSEEDLEKGRGKDKKPRKKRGSKAMGDKVVGKTPAGRPILADSAGGANMKARAEKEEASESGMTPEKVKGMFRTQMQQSADNAKAKKEMKKSFSDADMDALFPSYTEESES